MIKLVFNFYIGSDEFIKLSVRKLLLLWTYNKAYKSEF